MHRLRALVVVGVLLAGCGSGNGSAGASPRGSQPAVEAAPFGTVATIDGGTLDGASLAGQDLALWFWAPW